MSLNGEKWPADLAGQGGARKSLQAAAAKLVHAYLFVGPPGTGKAIAARTFAGMLLCPSGEGGDDCGTCRRVSSGAHPDFVVVEREGAALSIDQAREVTRTASRSAVEGGRLVIVLPDLHLAGDAVPALLKTIEEPPAHVVFVGLAEFVPPELVTLASRCALVEFQPLSEGLVAAALQAEGLPADRAARVAGLAGGRLDRARLLATDADAEPRYRAWAAVPSRLDGSGATVALLVDELVELLRRSTEPLAARQSAEVAALAERTALEFAGAPGRSAQGAARAAARELEERHRREQRRQRTDELRTGLGALARAYRDRAATGALSALQGACAVRLIDGLSADLAFNPGEQLALQALFVRLDRVASS